jgi:hypothetical protein
MAVSPEQLRAWLVETGRFRPDEVDDFVRRARVQEDPSVFGVFERATAAGARATSSGVDPEPLPTHSLSMSDERVARLEGAYDALKVVRPMTITVVSVLLAVLVFVLGFFAAQLGSLNTKIDAIPQKLSEEFRAMRSEMAAQTTAIATAITAARQMQPSSPAPPPQDQSRPANK